MASENDTVADIVREMRSEWAQVYFSEGSRRKDGEYCDNEFAAIEPETVADRIEEAYKREVAELRECLKETIVIAAAEYHYHSCFKHVKCGEIERCKTCKVVRWRKALKGTSND